MDAGSTPAISIPLDKGVVATESGGLIFIFQMKKKYFLIVWTLFLFTGYFLYFSPLSLYHLNKKTDQIKYLEEKNQILQIRNNSFLEEKFDLEKKNYFVDMGYSEKNQIIVDIRLSPLVKDQQSPPASHEDQGVLEEDSLISSLIFFFFLSLFVIIFFIFYYQGKQLSIPNNTTVKH